MKEENQIMKVQDKLVEKIYAYLEREGFQPKLNISSHNVIKSRCPFPDHEDRSPSFYIYKSRETGLYLYKCFGCGRGGSIQQLAKLLGISNDAKTFSKPKQGVDLSPDDIQTICQLAHKHFLNVYKKRSDPLQDDEWLVVRGFLRAGDPPSLAIQFIQNYQLGAVSDELPEIASRFLWRIIIPYRNPNSEVIWFNARSVAEDIQPKYLNAGGSAHVYLPEPTVIETAIEKGYCFIVEGEIDAISFHYATDGTIPVVGLSGGTAIRALEELLKYLDDSDVTFYILMDPDPAGMNLSRKILEYLHSHGKSAEAIRLLKDGSPWNGDINDFLKKYGKEDLRDAILEKLGRLQDIGDSWFIKDLPIILQERKNRLVFPTGIEELDEAIGGGFGEGLHIIGGLTATGKTSFALRVAINNAMAERPVLYFTYEMSKFDLWARILSSFHENPKFFYWQFKKGEIEPAELERFLKEIPEINQIASYLKILEGDAGMVDRSAQLFTVDEIESLARKISQSAQFPPLIIVDYIQRMPVGAELKRKDLRERIDIIVSGLQTRVARGIGSPVLALSSVSRGFYDIEPDDPVNKKISAFKESGGIEFTGYTVSILYTHNEDLYFEILKNRENGILKRWLVFFDPERIEWQFDGEG